METRYFDEWEFYKAIEQELTSPLKTKQKLEEYLKKYPKDYSAYFYYSSVLIKLQMFEEAEKMLNKTEKLMNEDPHFAKNYKKIQIIKQNILFDRLKVLAYKGKYIELYSLYTNSGIKLADDKNIDDVIYFCKKQLGLLNKNREAGCSYLFRQILEYSEEDFWDHVQKHLADYNSDLDERNKNIFVPEFPIKEVIKEAKEKMFDENRMCTGFYDDTYIFRYDECGRVDNRLVNYLKIVCFHNTKNIITVVPVIEGEEMPHVDLNYMAKQESKKEIKRISAVEKFNKRFKR